MPAKNQPSTKGYKLRQIPGAEDQVIRWFADGIINGKVARLVRQHFAINYSRQSIGKWKAGHQSAIDALQAQLGVTPKGRKSPPKTSPLPIKPMRCDDPMCPCLCHAHQTEHAPDAA